MTVTASNRATVLVADESAATRGWSEQLLRRAGHQVLVASDGLEALETARREAPDVLVLDDEMPGLTGREVIERLRGEEQLSGIIMLAGREQPRMEALALRTGADDWLPKHCDADELTRAVEQVCVRSRTRRMRKARLTEMDGELRAAAAIQAALLPERAPAPPGYRLDWAVLPAHEVAGDLFDAAVYQDRLCLLVADVSGKGVGAGLLSGMARTALRLALARGDDPAEAMMAAGRLLYADLERTGRFLTGCAFSLDPATGLMRYADAGHGHHLLLTPDGEAAPLPGGGLPLGFMAQPELEVAELTMPPGSRLALFSDGLVEGVGEPAERRARLAEDIAAGRDARDIVAEAPDDDDRTLAVLERLA